MSYLISPPIKSEWRADRQEVIDLLRSNWHGVEVGGPIPDRPIRDVTWIIDGLEGSQDASGRCQYLDGPLDMIARVCGVVAATRPG